LQLKAWSIMVAVAVVAVICAAARIDSAPRAAVAIVGSCFVVLASKHYSETVALRRASGLTTNRPKKAGLLLVSASIAAAIVGLSDVAFLAGYYGYLKIASEAVVRSHWTPYKDSGHMATGGIIGLILALRVASSLRQTIWLQERDATRSPRRFLKLWPVVVAVLIILALGVEKMYQRWRFCTMMAEYHASPEAHRDVPNKAALHAWLKLWYEKAALRPWLPIDPDIPPGL
jgi:hypothetical protein